VAERLAREEHERLASDSCEQRELRERPVADVEPEAGRGDQVHGERRELEGDRPDHVDGRHVLQQAVQVHVRANVVRDVLSERLKEDAAQSQTVLVAVLRRVRLVLREVAD